MSNGVSFLYCITITMVARYCMFCAAHGHCQEACLCYSSHKVLSKGLLDLARTICVAFTLNGGSSLGKLWTS